MSAARSSTTTRQSSITSILIEVVNRVPTEEQPSLSERSGGYLLDPRCRRDPHEFLRELSTSEPVHCSATGAWIISGYDMVMDALRDDRLNRGAAGYETADTLFDPGPAVDLFRGRLVNSDGETHARRRKLVNRSFTPRAITKWLPMIQETVDELIDVMEPAHAADLVRAFCYPVPERVICELLGVPHEDHEQFEEWTQVLNNRAIIGADSEKQQKEGARALIEFGEYVRSLVKRRQGHPTDDLVSQLIATEAAGEGMDEIELVAMIVEMIGGGHDTTANTIANGLLDLLSDRDRFEELSSDPELVPNAVEEILRYRSPVQVSLSRLATEDVTYGGVTIPKGSIVILTLAGANRDPEVFPDGQRFDITRDAHENPHLSFGFGTHYCLGASLARAEIQIALSTLIRRLPGLRLAAEPTDLPYRESALITAPAELPVTW